jgi:hypothetical protein
MAAGRLTTMSGSHHGFSSDVNARSDHSGPTPVRYDICTTQSPSVPVNMLAHPNFFAHMLSRHIASRESYAVIDSARKVFI